jgi:hypothetical protein
MAGTEIDLLGIERGLVVAPAGCGKTQLIADALARHAAAKPILVLTHTNAGVVALRARLDRAGLPPARYRLMTLDGWALRLATMFPTRAQFPAKIPARPSYPRIREAAIRLLKDGHIADSIRASYARLFVDEYQDCSIRQHALIHYAAHYLPTSALGDPMQAIFGFSTDDPLASWEEHVCGFFPKAGELNQPWRWINAQNEPLGQWLLDVRQKLMARQPICLRTAPEAVTWIQLDGMEGDHAKLANAARWTGKAGGSRVLVIGDSRNRASRHQLARIVPGAVVIEPVDLSDMVDFLRDLDLKAQKALERILGFAEDVMTGVGRPDLLSRVGTLTAGTARKGPSNVERAALSFLDQRSAESVAALLSAISAEAGVRIFRPGVLRGCIRALQIAGGASGPSLHDAAIQVREQNRLLGRPLPKRAIGSTLLLKGLEAEGVVILNGHDLDARNLYVALTRGSKFVVVCSKSPVLRPSN